MPKVKQATAVFHLALRWSVPHTPDNLETLRTWIRANADKYVFQAEDTGDNPHYQGYLHVPVKLRPSTLAISANPTLRGVEIQAASTAGVASLKKYCMKQDTRVDGPWADKKIYLGRDLWDASRQPPWQRKLWAMIQTDPDDRKLVWIYDPIGNNGKSKFLKWLSHTSSSLMLGYGHAADLLNLVSKFPGKNHYGFNQTRAKPHNLQEVDMYSAMESIKDGHFINLKYETAEVLMDPPHVTCFSNHLPKVNLVSLDRWAIYKIVDSDLVRITANGVPISQAQPFAGVEEGASPVAGGGQALYPTQPLYESQFEGEFGELDEIAMNATMSQYRCDEFDPLDDRINAYDQFNEDQESWIARENAQLIE